MATSSTPPPVLGGKIEVYWPMDSVHYKGRVTSFDSTTKKHTITYDDGDVEHLDMTKETWRYIDHIAYTRTTHTSPSMSPITPPVYVNQNLDAAPLPRLLPPSVPNQSAISTRNTVSSLYSKPTSTTASSSSSPFLRSKPITTTTLESPINTIVRSSTTRMNTNIGTRKRQRTQIAPKAFELSVINKVGERVVRYCDAWLFQQRSVRNEFSLWMKDLLAKAKNLERIVDIRAAQADTLQLLRYVKRYKEQNDTVNRIRSLLRPLTELDTVPQRRRTNHSQSSSLTSAQLTEQAPKRRRVLLNTNDQIIATKPVFSNQTNHSMKTGVRKKLLQSYAHAHSKHTETTSALPPKSPTNTRLDRELLGRLCSLALSSRIAKFESEFFKNDVSLAVCEGHIVMKKALMYAEKFENESSALRLLRTKNNSASYEWIHDYSYNSFKKMLDTQIVRTHSSKYYQVKRTMTYVYNVLKEARVKCSHMMPSGNPIRGEIHSYVVSVLRYAVKDSFDPAVKLYEMRTANTPTTEC